MTARALRSQLKDMANPAIAVHSRRFFKTGPGQYGEGDRFRGIRVPELRKLARIHGDLAEDDLLQVLRSGYHEDRLLALFILVRQFRGGTTASRRRIYSLYRKHTAYINGWDLVDASAEHIVGGWLAGRSRRPLDRLARSRSLWERRIAIMATFHFIKRNEFDDTFRLAEILLHDDEDLIHKAVGWMLREVGNRDRDAEERFLNMYYREMPRTMLRYAIERFPEPRRKGYLEGRVRQK